VTGVHDDESHSVSALNGANLVDPSDDHVFKPLAHALDAFDDQTEVVEDHAKFFGRLSDVDESRNHDSEIFTRTAPRIACRSQ